MLRYSVKPSKDTVLSGFPIKELYVAPDLSLISGVTDYNVGIVNGEEVVIKSPYLIGNEINTINTVNVKRQGRLGVSIELPVKIITTALNFPVYSETVTKTNGETTYSVAEYYILAYNHKVVLSDEEYSGGDYILSSITQNYLEFNGDIIYFFSGSTDDTSGYLINHKFYTATTETTSVTITTYVYIEDGELHLDDKTYHADFTEKEEDGSLKKPTLKLDKHTKEIEANEEIGGLYGYPCSALPVSDEDESLLIVDYQPSEWKRITKFTLVKPVNPRIEAEDVMYGGYRHYVTYKDSNYYFRDVYDDETGEYLGYGAKVNGYFYPALNNYGPDELYEEHHDLPYAGGVFYVAETDDYLDIEDSLVSQTDGGKFIILVDSFNNNDIQSGNRIIAESELPIQLDRYVYCETQDNGDEEPICVNKYITFQGNKYYVEDRLYDTVFISGIKYVLTYLNKEKTSASTIINGETIYFDVKKSLTEESEKPKYEATISYKIYYDGTEYDEETGEQVDDFFQIKYGIKETPYKVETASGVTVNGNKYEVLVEEIPDTEDEESDKESEMSIVEYVTLVENLSFLYEVSDVNGNGTYLLYPVINRDTIDDIDEDALQREINSVVVENWKVFAFYLKKDTFGIYEYTVDNGLMNSMSSDLPYMMPNLNLLEREIEILRVQNYIEFKFPLNNSLPNNLMREDAVKHNFVNEIRKESIDTIVDMEKDVYYPVWSGDSGFNPIEQIRFNLHFRTRNLDNWKVIEDDREYTSDRLLPNCNWFVTDNAYYSGQTDIIIKKHLNNASDLLGYLNFTTDDIKYQSTKIGKSFLRLSFYTSTDPREQVLLNTSTVFFNENSAYIKYLNSKRNSDMAYVEVNDVQNDYQSNSNLQNLINKHSSNTISNFTELMGDKYFNDNSRLSSRFIIENKFMTDTSSEGFYLYMFKEYGEKMREQTIYMKVEFNHAGIGKTVQFMLPRKEDGSLLYLHKENDVKTLKQGFPMKDIYYQTYIPINIVYDEASNKYVYYLPNELRENNELGVDNEIMEFNLFEVKFANESLIQLT